MNKKIEGGNLKRVEKRESRTNEDSFIYSKTEEIIDSQDFNNKADYLLDRLGTYDFSKEEMMQYLETNESLSKILFIAIKDKKMTSNDHYLKVLKNIQFLPKKDQFLLQNHFLEIIKTKFEDRNKLSKKDIKLISFIPEKERMGFIEKLIKEFPHLRSAVKKIVESLSEKDIKKLEINQTYFHKEKKQFIKKLEKATECNILRYKGFSTNDKEDRRDRDNKLLSKVAMESSLYGKAPKIFRVGEIEKTGSRLFLIDKLSRLSPSLKEKIIIRDIKLNSYFAWKKAFEASDFWKERGFDYIPIEPIKKINYYSPNHNKVGVETGVIKGPNVGKWIETTSIFRKEILENMEEIAKGLSHLKIMHGHLHIENFVLSFYLDKDGNLDLDRIPRLYVIDFDKAITEEKNLNNI